MLENTAIILSGGKSSRMDFKNKAFFKMGGKSLIEVVLKEVSIFKEILVVANNPSRYQSLGMKIVPDIIPNHGPLSGIHAGLVHAKYENCMVLPCDMPFVTEALIKYLVGLAKDCDVVVPKVGDYFQPLCAVYSKNCIEQIERCMKSGINKVTDVYPRVKVKHVEEKEINLYGNVDDLFRNINQFFDYKKYCLQQEPLKTLLYEESLV